MTRFNTGNPVGSADPRDRHDNSRAFDQGMNSESPSFNDRLGRARKSWQAFEDQIDQQQSDFEVAQSDRESDYASAETARNIQTNNFIANHGSYVNAGDYAAGIEITQYNEVVRDSGGEFWRVSGSTNLPYTTGGGGLPEGGVFVPVGDAAIRQQLAKDNGYRLVANQMAANSYGSPAKLKSPTVGTETHRIVDYFGGKLYATQGGNLFESDDFGASYSQIVTGKAPIGIIPTNDGEVAILFSNRIEKSSGWSVNPSTATWTVVLSLPTQTESTFFLRWGFDGDGQKFIATHYGNTGAIYRVWVSTDAGDTFDLAYDQSSETADRSHMHAACYDPWDDRFYFAYGHGDPAGIYYSDDDGATWTKMSQYSFQEEGVMATFTTMVATDFGIVCGTDRFPNGVYILRRSDNPDDIKLELAKRWDSVRGGLLGFADRAFRDSDTGIVYTSFRSDWQEVAPVIIACGSGGAEIIYTAELDQTNPRRIQNVIAANGNLIAYVNQPDQTINGKLEPYTVSGNANRGNLLTDNDAQWNSVSVGRDSKVTGSRSVAVGFGAKVLTGTVAVDDCAVLGYESFVTGGKSVAIGSQVRSTPTGVGIGHNVQLGTSDTATESGIVAIGSDLTVPGSLSTVVGAGITVSGVGATAFGQSAKSAGGSAFGRGADATGGDSSAFGAFTTATGFATIAVGRDASSTGAYSVTAGYQASDNGVNNAVVLGRTASASAIDCVAVGYNASAAHSSSVAIGKDSQTQRSGSISVGERDIESTKVGGGVILKSPNGTAYKITVDDSGNISAAAV